MSSLWDWPGARWWKVDFHTHTSASRDTVAWQKAIGTAEEVTPERWLMKFMAAGIDCVVVTDHNTGDWIDRLGQAYDAMRAVPPQGFRDLTIFPGVEISVNGGIHLLAIFDPQEGSKRVATLLGAVGFPVDLHGQTDAENCVACTRKSLVEVVEEIHRLAGIAVPSHCDQDKGLLQTDGGHAAHHADAIKGALGADLLAIEVVDPLRPKPSVYTDSGRRWTEVLGSDCHSFQGAAAPGSRFTWVKMAQPSLEGLRLALLDGEGVSIRRSDSCVFDPFKVPEHTITAIEIDGLRFMGNGQPARLPFSPYFTALVGGRGTGKSTIVHALRLAYRREGDLQRLGEQSEARETFERFSRVPRNRGEQGALREGTRIALSVMRDGVPYRIHWRQGGAGTVVEDCAADAAKPSASQEVSPERFPVRIFSQGQIAALAGESQDALLALLDEAAGTGRCHAVFAEARQSYLSTMARVRELDGKLLGRNAVVVQLQDAQRKLGHFEASGHAGVLKSFQAAQRHEHEVTRQADQVAGLMGQVRALAADFALDDLPPGVFAVGQDDDILAALAELRQAVAAAQTALEGTAQRLEGELSRVRRDERVAGWQARVDAAKTAYSRLVGDLQKQGIGDPAEYGRVVQERQRLETEMKRFDSFQVQRQELVRQSRTQMEAVWGAREAITAARRSFLASSLAGNPFVRIELIPFAEGPKPLERSLRDIIGVVDDRFGDDILVIENDSATAGLVAEFGRPSDRREAVRQLQTRLVEGTRGEGALGGAFRNYLKRKAGQAPEFVDRIQCWFPADSLQVEYSRGGDGQDFRPIAQASAGQRAAAMLALLLSYGTEPLVLDQPEDDLDNHLIYDLVVRQIREHKLRRQLIVVTHNPNIVVNGDAEMIHALGFASGQCVVTQQGSMQDKAMREEICRIMEGGREAFERRWRRLGKEL